MSQEFIITTPEQVEIKFELAGIGSRFIASLLDSLVLGAIFVLIGLVIYVLSLASLSMKGLGENFIIVLAIILIFIVSNGYFLYFELTKNGQTPGKKAVGIRVVRDSGHPIDFRAALLRNIMRIVDYLPGFYGVGVISMIASKQYRRLGDYVGGTLVVKVGHAPIPIAYSEIKLPSFNDFELEPVSKSELPLEAMQYVGSITKDEYRAIKHFLDRRYELEDQIAKNLANKFSYPIAEKMKIDINTIDDCIAFLDSVRKEWERRMIH